jgi:hypothetical protein
MGRSVIAPSASRGGRVLAGVYFYKMHARVLVEVNGWCTLMTNSAKRVNIIAGYRYEPALADGPLHPICDRWLRPALRLTPAGPPCAGRR